MNKYFIFSVDSVDFGTQISKKVKEITKFESLTAIKKFINELMPKFEEDITIWLVNENERKCSRKMIDIVFA